MLKNMLKKIPYIVILLFSISVSLYLLLNQDIYQFQWKINSNETLCNISTYNTVEYKCTISCLTKSCNSNGCIKQYSTCNEICFDAYIEYRYKINDKRYYGYQKIINYDAYFKKDIDKKYKVYSIHKCYYQIDYPYESCMELYKSNWFNIVCFLTMLTSLIIVIIVLHSDNRN